MEVIYEVLPLISPPPMSYREQSDYSVQCAEFFLCGIIFHCKEQFHFFPFCFSACNNWGGGTQLLS